MIALAAACGVTAGGCGSEDDFTATPSERCPPSQAECVTDQVARTCPADGSRWVSFSCDDSETCQGGICIGEPCTPADRECLSGELSRVCPADGSGWLQFPCNLGEACVDGICGGTSSSCEPGTKACATDRIAKVCESDGSGFVPFPCGEDEVCDTATGDCVVDLLGGVCEPGTAKCVGGLQSLVCQGGGTGYNVTNCPTEAPCRDGLCAGPVCRMGESFCDSTRIKTCVGGSEWKYTDCPPGQVCAARRDQDYTTASCVKAVCASLDTECGDPTDPSVDTSRYLSKCELTSDGSLDWVRYECSALEACDPTLSVATCSKRCTPGAQRCTTNLLGYQECTAAGTWGPASNCNATASEAQLQCQPKPGQIPGDLAAVVCSDPVCVIVQNSLRLEVGGTCDGAKLRRCDASGRLAPVTAAENCETGICATLSTTSYGGYLPGACREDCKAGDERCVGTGSPLYQQCVNGVWSALTQRCANSQPCWGYVEDGVQKKLCGGECTPGTRKCDGTSIQTCSAEGQWGASAACSLGTCRATTGSAACVVDCVPGTKVCTGVAKPASDGVSSGRTAEFTCTPEGTLPTTPTTCPGTTTCRTTRTGIHMGCVECLGPNAPGGNAMGLPDSRCAALTEERDSVQICGSNNDWSSPLLCPVGEACKQSTITGTCQTCVGTGPCTTAQVQLTYGASNTCSTVGFGSPVLCGTVSDCCSSYCSTTGTSLSAAFCGPG
jgi:hypothetical protein